MIRNTFAEINLSNLRHNFKTLRALAPNNTFFCPMIKSSAYGHGDVQVARSLIKEGANVFGVALMEEAIMLRESGIIEPILVFGPFNQEAISYVNEYKLIPVVSVWEQLLTIVKSQTPMPIHLKLNTGMNRLGLDEVHLSELIDLLNQNQQIKVLGLCSHLAEAEDFFKESSFTQMQIQKFEKFIKILNIDIKNIHLFNSSGLIANSIDNRFPFGSRPGISLYGVKPHLKSLNENQSQQWESINLKPVMTLKSEVIAYHNISKGEKVSYGGHWIAPRNSIIGVIPIGYGDGYHRLFSQKGVILYRGKRVPVVGTVCMDYTMVDLTDALQGSAGKWQEEVVLFGEMEGQFLAVEEIAKLASTISYELLTGIGKRVPRNYVE